MAACEANTVFDTNSIAEAGWFTGGGSTGDQACHQQAGEAYNEDVFHNGFLVSKNSQKRPICPVYIIFGGS